MRAHEESPPIDSEIVFFAPASVVVMLWAAIAAFSQAARARVARPRAPHRARLGGMAAPAPPPRPHLRPRRLAVRRAGLLIAAQLARSPPPLPLPRRRQYAPEPHHRLRLAPPPRHPSGTGAGVGHGTRRRNLGARRPARARAAAPAPRRCVRGSGLMWATVPSTPASA